MAPMATPKMEPSRTASLFLGKDYERWAHYDPDSMLWPVWSGVKSTQCARVSQWNDAPTWMPMRASSLGIMAEHTQESLHVSGSAMEGAEMREWRETAKEPSAAIPVSSPDRGPCGSPDAGTSCLAPGRNANRGCLEPGRGPAARAKSPLSPTSASALQSPGSPRSPGSPNFPRSPEKRAVRENDLPHAFAERASIARASARSPPCPSTVDAVLGCPRPTWARPWAHTPTVETRRYQRSKLLHGAMHGAVGAVAGKRHIIPVYGNGTIFSLAPRRTVEYVEGTLYDVEGPFREGAVTDSLSVRLFYAPGPGGAEGVSYLITTPDNRVFSAAKRRRWAMDNRGNFFAAMEIKSVEAKLEAANYEEQDPVRAQEYETDLRKHFIDDVLDELQKAETLTPQPTVVPHVLQTEDGKLVRLEEDFPEEAFFAIAGCDEDDVYPIIALVFVEAIQALWRLHSHGWMHGDIKLENLMFNPGGKLMLIDFENASPFRGSPQHDGKIQLLSYDWTPPELEVSAMGRRMGPSGDLWALGCNMIRAFALRDGVEDPAVRKLLMGDRLGRFMEFRTQLHNPACEYEIDLALILAHARADECARFLHPARLLRRFAREAPRLLQYVLRYSVTPTPSERNEEKGLELALHMAQDPANQATWARAKKALDTSINASGSMWVRPKLDEARAILELA
ncbi:hypothetical protein MSPP1_002227 [Malassezia sp. CBS 17886]|nr:hypothetical protein MSPP1_002227 [Malassezia sp. CBS 17886]